MNTLLSLKLKTATDQEIGKIEKNEDDIKFELRGVECPAEEELDEDVLDPKPDLKPKVKKKKKRRKKKPEPKGPEVKVSNLDGDSVSKLYKRLPEFTGLEEKPAWFRPDETMKPPPKNEKFVEVSFPPKNQLKKTMSQNTDDRRFKPTVELMVRSVQPRGNVSDLKALIRINFSHTMFQEDVSISPKPDDILRLQKKVARIVKVDPPLPPKGLWKWETDTMLVWTPDEEDRLEGHLCPSTNYSVKIPAGVKSKRGHVLANDYNFSFQTPIISIKKFCPTSTYPTILTRNPIMGFEFSQRVDKKKLVKKMYVAKSGTTEEYLKVSLLKTSDVIKRINDEAFYCLQPHTNIHPMHVMKNSCEIYYIERETDKIDKETGKKIIEKIPKVKSFGDNVVFFTTNKRLLGNTGYECFVKKGLKPIRGNLTSSRDYHYRFQTMQPLHISSHNIPSEVYEHENVKWYMTFNNSLNEALWSKKWFKVNNLKNAKVEYDTEKRTVNITGRVIRYKKNVEIKVSKKIEDVYGNRFENERVFKPTIRDRLFNISSSLDRSNQHCHDDVSWNTYFNWNIKKEQVEDFRARGKLSKLITVKPELKNQRIEIEGARVVIRGNPVGTKEFKVKFFKKLMCEHDTELIEDLEIRIFMLEETPILTSQHNQQVFVHDPTNPSYSGQVTFNFRVRNYDSVRVIVYQVTPEDDFEKAYPMGPYYMRVQNWTKMNQLYDIKDLTGIKRDKIVYDGTVKTGVVFNEKKLFEFNCVPYLQHSKQLLGQLYIVVIPPGMQKMQNCLYSWMQVTRTSFETVLSNDQTATFVANSILDGAFIENQLKYSLVSIYDYKTYKDRKMTERLEKVTRDLIVYKYYEGVRKRVEKFAAKTAVTQYDYSKNRQILEGTTLAVLRNGNDTCFVRNMTRHSMSHVPETKLLPFCFDDKKMYKPKEKCYIKCMMRILRFENQKRRLEMLPASELPLEENEKTDKVKYTLFDARDVKYKEGEIEIDDCSSFFFVFDVPAGVNLGNHRAEFEVLLRENEKSTRVNECKFTHNFKVEEFEPPEFVSEVKVFNKKHFVNDKALVTAQANYYSGGGLYDCKVAWTVTQSFQPYTPPGVWSGYQFQLPSGLRGSQVYPSYSDYSRNPQGSYNFSDGTCKTSPLGEHKMLVELWGAYKFQQLNHYQLNQKRNYLLEEAKLRTHKVSIVKLNDGKQVILPLLNDKVNDLHQPMKVTCKARITDISQNVLESSGNFVVHPSRYYVGVKRKDSAGVYLEEQIKLEVIVVDVEGKTIPDWPVYLEVFRYSEKKKIFEFKSKNEAYNLSIPLHEEWGTGTFHFVATVFDPKGMKNCSSLQVYANSSRMGQQQNLEQFRREIERKMKAYLTDSPTKYDEVAMATGNVEIIADKAKYFVGDTARIVVKNNGFINATGFLYIVGYSLIFKKKFVLENLTDMAFEIKIEDNFVPNVQAHVILMGNKLRRDINNFEISGDLDKLLKDKPGIPSCAKGVTTFRVTPESYELKLGLKTPETIYSPGDTSKVDITVEGGVPGEKTYCTLLIVDESVLALTGYKVEFPINHFYPNNNIHTMQYFLRNRLFVRKWRANMQKIEEARNKLKEGVKAKELEIQQKEAEKLRKIEAKKVRVAQWAEVMKEEQKRRRLYRLKQEMNRPKPPKIVLGFSKGGRFRDRIMEKSVKRRSRKKMKKKSRAPMLEDLICESAPPPMPSRSMAMPSMAPMMKLSAGPPMMEKEECKKMEAEMCFDEEEECEDDEDMGFEEMEGDCAGEGIGGGAVIEDTGDDDTPIAMRKMFESTVVFATCVATENGKATVEFKLPDQLTKYSIWCLAEQGSKYYGFGESSIIAKLPFNIRPVIPPFLNFGDQIELGFVLGNQSEATLKLKCALRTTEGLLNYGSHGYTVLIPQGLRGEVKFKVLAKDVGEGRLQVAASAGRFNDAVEKMIEVYSPALVSNFVVYGELDADACHIQQVIPPEHSEVHDGFGGLEIQTSSTVFQQLTDAFLYVYNYEYDCVEQASSRALSIFSMVDIVEKFKLNDCDKVSKILGVMENSLVKLTETQKDNGGYGFWHKGSAINVYLSIHAAHATVRIRHKYPELFTEKKALSKKFTAILERSKTFVYSLTSYIPVGYRALASVSVRAFSLYVLAHYNRVEGLLTDREKQKCTKRCNQLFTDFKNVDNQTNECKAWLMFALSEFAPKEKEKINTLINSLYKCLKEEKMTAYFNPRVTYENRFGKLEMLGSTMRENGVILEVLCHLNPTDAVIPKLVKHLLKLKKYGKWGNTNENQSILLGLTTYFNIFEKDEPNFDTEIWVQNDYCGKISFKGRETDFKVLNIPMKKLVITEEEKKKIQEKRAILEKRSEEVKQELQKRLEETNKRYEEKFGELFNLMRKKYEMEMMQANDALREEMGVVDKEIKEGVVKKEEKKEKEKKKFKLFDFGSQAKKVDDDDVEFFSEQISKRKKIPIKDIDFNRRAESQDLTYFTKRIEKNRKMVELDETHEDEEEKILNSIKNKQVYLMKKGKGRLYYRLKFKYAPKDLKIYAFDFGFNVIRSYHHVGTTEEAKKEVVKDIASGMYTVKHGCLVRIRVQFTIKETRFHTALCCPTPAGLEILNPNLKTTIAIPPDTDYRYNQKWYDHVNYRFERVEVFKSELRPGTYCFSYVCRAKYVGNFTALPAKCEEMYNEEITGQCDTDFVQVKIIEDEVESEWETDTDSDSEEDGEEE